MAWPCEPTRLGMQQREKTPEVAQEQSGRRTGADQKVLSPGSCHDYPSLVQWWKLVRHRSPPVYLHVLQRSGAESMIRAQAYKHNVIRFPSRLHSG